MSEKLYKVDKKAQELIEQLKEELSYETDSRVLMMALTLLKLASDANKKGEKTLIGGKEVVL